MKNSFRKTQWRMLLATMFCYLFYYTGRQNFGFAVKPLQDELGLSATEVGAIGGAMLLCYGFGQAVNGNLGDKFGARWLMTIGAFLSIALNWITSFGQSFLALLIPWSLNGYAQSLGWAPGSRLIANWWSHQERGKAFGYYVFATGFSSALTFALCITLLHLNFSWQWLFRLPVLLLFIGGSVFFLIARDRPEDLNFKPIPDESDRRSNTCEGSDETGESSMQRYLHVLKNTRFLIACLAIGCVTTARYGLLHWVPLHFLGSGWKEDPASGWIVIVLPIGMACGALSAGQVSDRIMGSNRSRTIALFLLPAACVSMLLFFIPPDAKLLSLVLLFLIGFLIYGPMSSFWALCADLLGRDRTGTGVGLMNASAYGFAAIGDVAIGAMIDATQQSASAFAVVAGACLLGALLILFVRQ